MLTSRYIKSLLQMHLGSEPNQTKLTNLYVALTPIRWKLYGATTQATQSDPLAIDWFRRNLPNLQVVSLDMNIVELRKSLTSLQVVLDDIGKEMIVRSGSPITYLCCLHVS
jgi:hypothetical protein